MRRSLSHYWRINLAVILSGAVATAVLTGALLVGDSVKGSLRELTLDRLGEVDYLVNRHSFFRQSLMEDIISDQSFAARFSRVAPAIITTGNAVHAKTRTRASRINITAVDERFLYFFPNTDSDDFVQAIMKQQVFPSIVINESLQRELNAQVGDQILLSLERPSEIARSSLLGYKETDDIVETSRFSLTKVIPDQGLGRFGIRAHQNLTLNAYVFLPVLQKSLGQKGRVNSLVITGKEAGRIDDSAELRQALAGKFKLEDLGLKTIDREDVFILECDDSIFSSEEARLVIDVAAETGLSTLPSYTYLANQVLANGRVLPYSTISAIETEVDGPFKTLTLTSGRPAPGLKPNEILLNSWAAEDLGVRTGDNIQVSYFAVGPRDELFVKEHEFHLAGILRMTGLAADKTLTPDYPGIADADNMVDWDPPFHVDLSLIRRKDEDYWDQYRGTPKAFVSLETGQKLWGSRFGNITSIRLGPASGGELAALQAAFRARLIAKARPEEFGYSFQALKAQGLASSSGATDFGGLFIAFSQFLIVSAALLVGLLFRLGVEQRAKEIGMLFALGYTVRHVRSRFLAEGGLLAGIGALAGLAGGILYAWFLMFALRTWWVAAVGSSVLFLHVSATTLVIGFLISALVILSSIWLGFRKLSKLSPPALLAGVTIGPESERSRQFLRWLGPIALLSAIAIVISGLTAHSISASPESFFVGGALLLISGLCFFSLWLRGAHRSLSAGAGPFMIARMAARNAPRNPGRSMLSAALVACACFVIVAVGANRHDFGNELRRKDSGAGGFSLLARADIPILHDLGTEDGRFSLGFSTGDSELLADSEIVPFRFLAGEDASCLNLYQVEKPRILGVPETQIERGGFGFQSLLAGETNGQLNPWRLLQTESEPGVIPAFGDANSVIWILHSGLGKDIEMTDDFGNKVRLRFVGLLQKSIFQSEVLISEENFLKHFPGRSGYAYYLMDAPPDQLTQRTEILESTLSDYGFDVSTTAETLSSYQAVENTYLSTFQTLGGLGLLLGTLGLGMILIRNVIERRGELATLRAFGFNRNLLGFMVLAENAFLLGVGLLMGTLAAAIAVTPNLITNTAHIPWLSLGITLALVFFFGMLSSVVAVRQAVRIPLLPALRAE